MRKTERKTIGTSTYLVSQVGALEGQRILTKIAKHLIPALAAAAGENDPKEARIARATETLAQNIDSDLFEEVASAMAKQTVVQVEKGQKGGQLLGIYDEHFAGNYLELAQWFVFAVEVNFGGFFRDILSAVPSTGSKSATPTE